MHTDSDADLDAQLARLADGDRSAFTAVFKHLQQPIFRLCMSMLKNEADALDATQEALEKVLARASDYDRRRRAMPWACAIAAWECRTTLKKRSRRAEVQEGEHPSTDAELALEQRDLVEAALHAMGTLSDVDRETLIATFKEEAGDLGEVGAATLRKRRERALVRLRSAFRRLYGLD